MSRSIHPDDCLEGIAALEATGLSVRAWQRLFPREQMRRFHDALGVALRCEGANMISAEPGREGAVLIWLVSLHTPRRGVQVFVAPFPGEGTLYAPHILGGLVGRLRQALASEGSDPRL